MSFQGDVAGLGLGELLQGLARGGREGVLTLYGGGLSATLGVLAGQIHLLPEPDEDPEIWRKRAGRAWPDDNNERVDSMRMVEIAHAARIERVFELLDCDGVHFRFEPGALPNSEPSEDAELAALTTDRPKSQIDAKVPVFTQPVSVEFLLLEHARLSDECNAHGDSRSLSIHEVPCPLVDPSQLAGDKLFAECDGQSNVIEISDRLAWPLRQTKAAVFSKLAEGNLRLATANELAALTQNELAQNRFLRAASRLSGWAANAAPGAPEAGEGELLIEEWNGGKLVLALAGMSSSDTRTVLRRMEMVEADPKASLARWKEICKHHRHDLIAEVHVLRLGLALEDESQRPTFAELLKVARHFQDQDRMLRAGALLVAAASRNPESTQNRLELGNRLLACGLTEEATPWILEACRALLQGGLADKAIAPLRALVAADPTNRDARSLFNVTRAKSTQGRAKTRNLWIALASVVILALVALVQVHSDRALEQRLIELETSDQRPEVLLRVLQEDYPESRNAHVLELRRRFTDDIRKRELQLREEWLSLYAACQQECDSGDPRLGFERTQSLPPAPTLTLVRDPWPTISDLLQALAGKLEQEVGLLSETAPEDESTAGEEQRLSNLVRDLISLVEARPRSDALDGFAVRLRHMLDTLRTRGEQRATVVRAREAKDLNELQGLMLDQAKALAAAGDLDAAAEMYRKLCDLDPHSKLVKVLAPERHALEVHRQALAKARKLALEGRHADAIATLGETCQNPSEHRLPWLVQSTPSGATVRFADGTTDRTPCVIESAPGQAMNVSVELEGYEPIPLRSSGPADVALTFSRLPNLWWRTSAVVVAVPVAIEDDYLVVDRSGNLARLATEGAQRWQQSSKSLSGFFRAPVFLPDRPGSLLCLTEHGEAWIVDGADGRMEGPWDIGSPPIAGPKVVGDRVVASFADGREASWDSRLKPELSPLPEAGATLKPIVRDAGSDAGMAKVAQRDVNRGASHDSPWSDWTVEIGEEFFSVRPRGASNVAFHVARRGDWSYLAWEAPRGAAKNGRLWISDGAGLRAFEP